MFNKSIRCLTVAMLYTGAALAEKKAIRPPASATAGPYSAGVLTGRLLYVSGHVGPEPGGGFAAGDVKTQTRRCLELVGKVLKEAGLDYRNVVSTTLYLADIRTLDAADVAYREVFTAPPYPARVEIESQLLIPEALAEVSAVALMDDGPAATYLKPNGWVEPVRPYSHAVLASGTLFFSTLRPVDPISGKLAGATIREQTMQIMRNRQAVLAAAGIESGHAGASRVYLTDPSYSAGFRANAAALWPAQATAIAAPAEPGHLLQLQSIALAPPTGPLLVAGATGRAPGGTYPRNDIKAQTRHALRAIEGQLSSRGLTFADAVDAVVWLRDPRHAAAMNEVYREMVKPNPPARATVRLASVDADALIQIVMTAQK